MRTLLLTSLTVLSMCGAEAQSAPAPLAFEVASIKLNPGPWHVLVGYSATGSRLTLEGYDPVNLVLEAYNLKRYQIQWATPPTNPSDQPVVYDIAAKAEGDRSPTRAEFRQMLQSLLASRFQLKFHWEMREMPVYELVIAKNGPKFKASSAQASFAGQVSVNGRNQIATLTHATMDEITKSITFLDRPVIDRTGLTGFYDIRLEATPEFRINNNPQPGDITMFTAVQEQLGLKLEPQKALIEVLVIDSIEKPSEN